MAKALDDDGAIAFRDDLARRRHAQSIPFRRCHRLPHITRFEYAMLADIYRRNWLMKLLLNFLPRDDFRAMIFRLFAVSLALQRRRLLAVLKIGIGWLSDFLTYFKSERD